MIYNFVIGDTYSRKNVKKIIGAENPDSIGGIWGTGYIKYNSSFFIFANITTQGRTGHNYHNILNDNSLYWYTKNRDHLNVPTISEMTSGDHEVYIMSTE